MGADKERGAHRFTGDRQYRASREFIEGKGKFGSKHIVEFADGSWGYPNGQLIKDKSEVDWLPMPHRKRAESWVKNRSKSTKKAKAADEGLMGMSVEALKAMLGNGIELEELSHGELVSMVKEKESGKEEGQVHNEEPGQEEEA